MITKLISGKTVAKTIQGALAERLKALVGKPGLAIILVGNDPASEVYVRVKERACRELGIDFHLYRFRPNTLEPEILRLLDQLNADANIHAIVVQLPLPRHLDEDRIIRAIDWRKDVDGFHPGNIANVLAGKDVDPPSLIRAILELIKSTKTGLRGKRVAILANADAFVQPLAIVMKKKGALPSIVKAGDPYRPTTSEADIVIIAYGQPELLKGHDLKPGAVVIDVGINRLDDGRIVGDVEAETAQGVAAWLTPVPGGVGPVTVAMLLQCTVELFMRQTKQDA
jgi:methylenetetrahydrofolate dehydrogenase (NADP+)/methenyltetrahydrofolate cyclohydrolase